MQKPSYDLTLNRVLTFCACFLLSVTPLLGQGPGSKSFAMAENMVKQNRLDDAIRQYDEAIKLEPSNFKYWFQKGKCEYKMGKVGDSKESFKRTVEYRPNFTPAYALLAKIAKTEKDYPNAIYYYEEAARYESDPGRRVQYKLLLVNLLLLDNQVAPAKKHIEEAIAIEPANPNVLFYVGEIAAAEEQWDQARQSYEKALLAESLKDAPPADKAKYYYGLGLALSKLGDNLGARKAWSKANFGPYQQLISQQMLETNHVYYYKLAVSYYLNSDYAEADRYLNQALGIQKDFSSAYVLKAKIENKRGNADMALSNYQKAISIEKISSKRGQLYIQLAGLQAARNDHHNVLTSLDQAVKEDVALGAREDLQYMRARSEYSLGRYNDAVTTLEKLLAANVDTKSRAKYYFLMGMAAKNMSATEKAQEAFKNALYGPYKPAAQLELEKLNGRG